MLRPHALSADVEDTVTCNPAEPNPWYVIHTKPRQEGRVQQNLQAWGVPAFAPELRVTARPGRDRGLRPAVEPLFPQYIFARFRPETLLHKVQFTRGVHSVVSFGGALASVDDGVIRLIAARLGNGGFVTRGPQFKPGDRLIIRDGPFRELIGIFDHEVPAAQRVTILLTAVGYRARVEIDRGLVGKVNA